MKREKMKNGVYKYITVVLSGFFIYPIIMSNFVFPLKYNSKRNLNKNVRFNNTTYYSEAHKRLTEMMKTFNEICCKLNIHYWASGGTLIGSVRHRGHIPWDCDIDVCMTLTDYKLLKKHIDAMLPSNMAFFDKSKMPWLSNGLVKIVDLYSSWSSKKSAINEIHRTCGLTLDIFIFNEVIIKNTDYLIAITEWVNSPPYADGPHLRNDIFPTKKINFETIEVCVPKNVEKICIRGYGGFPPPFPPIKDQSLKYGEIDLKNPSPIFVNYYKDIYVKKLNQWFTELSSENRNEKLMHQQSGWSFGVNTWNELMSHIFLYDLNFNENSSGKLLEIGCGVGAFLNEINVRTKNIEKHGIDINETVVNKCKANVPSSILSVTDAKNLEQYENETFDYIVSISTISYLKTIEDVEKCINELLRVLKNGGIISLNLISNSPSNLGTYLTIIPETWWKNNKFNVSSISIFKPDNPDFKGRYCVKIIK